MNSIGNMNRTTLFYKIILDGLLFQEIKEFLDQTNSSTNNLLNVSREFKELKKDHFYCKMNKKYSLIYYTSSPYRERITLLIKTKRQLSLKLRGFSEVVDVSILADIHTLDLSLCSNISDVSLLGGVYKLDLSYCCGVVEVSALGHVYDLDLHECDNIVDVSALGGVYKLNLSYCLRVVNVSALGRVHD
jgi:hypothetical protein